MALLEKVFKGPGFLIGLGVVVAAPIVIPLAAKALRPAAKVVIRGCLAASGCVSGLTAGTQEQIKDLVAEVKAEREAGAKAEEPSPPRTTKTRAQKPQTETA